MKLISRTVATIVSMSVVAMMIINDNPVAAWLLMMMRAWCLTYSFTSSKVTSVISRAPEHVG